MFLSILLWVWGTNTVLIVFSQDYTSGMILDKVSSAKDPLTLTGISESQTIDITTLSKHLRDVKERIVFRSRVGKTLLVGLTWTATLSCPSFVKRVEVTERYLCYVLKCLRSARNHGKNQLVTLTEKKRALRYVSYSFCATLRCSLNTFLGHSRSEWVRARTGTH